MDDDRRITKEAEGKKELVDEELEEWRRRWRRNKVEKERKEEAEEVRKEGGVNDKIEVNKRSSEEEEEFLTFLCQAEC